MGDTPETMVEPRQRLDKEYEDPHYHDEDDVAPGDEPLPRLLRPAVRPPSRRLPPPPRGRFYED